MRGLPARLGATLDFGFFWSPCNGITRIRLHFWGNPLCLRTLVIPMIPILIALWTVDAMGYILLEFEYLQEELATVIMGVRMTLRCQHQGRAHASPVSVALDLTRRRLTLSRPCCENEGPKVRPQRAFCLRSLRLTSYATLRPRLGTTCH